MEIAFLEKDLKEMKAFLSQEQKEGSLYVAYPTGSRVFKSDLATFKSSFDVQEFCYENSTDRDRYNYSTIREMHENVDEALKREAYRQVIGKAPIVEDVQDNKPFDVLDNLVRNNVAKVHVQVEDKVKDSVNRFELVGNKATDLVYGGGYDQYFISKHVSLEDAKEALRLSVAADKEKPAIDQLNYMVIGKFPGVWPVFDPTGQPKEGTAVVMQTAIQSYNGKSQTWAYETKDVHGPEDTVKVNTPRFLTVDLDKQNYQLHDKMPDLKPERAIDLDKTDTKDITIKVSGGLSR